MGSYVVLARKWRPAQFADIVGQAPVVRTLMNAIRTDRIHQAYLFTGSRGIGKTSIARIIAKVIRCPETKWDGQWLNCCDTCSSCREVSRGNSVDVIEIDGASNNGVDHVREIRENAKFMPASGSRKIYIIDEVHMLSTAAFNALLKTLEEPPPHVVFMFATTEAHKIPATILSRVQRFDLRRVSAAQIQGRLVQVLESEGIAAEPGALALVARAAEGGLRDALSLLDQVIAFSGEKVTLQSVRESVGLIESQLVLSVLESILKREPIQCLDTVQKAYEQGHDLKLLVRHLIEFLHGTILAKVGSGAERAGEYTEAEWAELKRLAELRELEELELIFQALHQGVEWIARSPQPRTVLDVLLIKCATAEALVNVETPPAPGSSGRPGPTGSGRPTLAKPAPQTAAAAAHSQTSLQTYPQSSGAPAPAAPANWEGLIQLVRTSRPFLATALENGICAKYPAGSESTLSIQFAEPVAFYKDQLQNRAQADIFNQLLRQTLAAISRSRSRSPRALPKVLPAAASARPVNTKREREVLPRTIPSSVKPSRFLVAT